MELLNNAEQVNADGAENFISQSDFRINGRAKQSKGRHFFLFNKIIVLQLKN